MTTSRVAVPPLLVATTETGQLPPLGPRLAVGSVVSVLVTSNLTVVVAPAASPE